MTGSQLMTTSLPLTLVSHHLCPYVQRAVIALREKDVAFERLAIDLNNKPGWSRRSWLLRTDLVYISTTCCTGKKTNGGSSTSSSMVSAIWR